MSRVMDSARVHLITVHLTGNKRDHYLCWYRSYIEHRCRLHISETTSKKGGSTARVSASSSPTENQWAWPMWSSPRVQRASGVGGSTRPSPPCLNQYLTAVFEPYFTAVFEPPNSRERIGLGPRSTVRRRQSTAGQAPSEVSTHRADRPAITRR